MFKRLVITGAFVVSCYTGAFADPEQPVSATFTSNVFNNEMDYDHGTFGCEAPVTVETRRTKTVSSS